MTGPTGAQGVTGPTGSTGPRGITAVIDVSFNDTEAIQYATIEKSVFQQENVTYTADLGTDEIVINEAGFYEITFCGSISDITTLNGGSVALSCNGTALEDMRIYQTAGTAEGTIYYSVTKCFNMEADSKIQLYTLPSSKDGATQTSKFTNMTVVIRKYEI